MSRGNYTATAPTLADGENWPLRLDSAGKLLVSAAVDINAADLQIGAVEIKNATDDTRATVGANGLQVETRGAAAHDAAISGNPIRIGARALAANYTAVATGDAADLVSTLVGALIVKPYALPELDWQYAAASGGITDTSDVEVKAAAAGLKHYVTGCQVVNTDATVGTELVIKSAATVIFRIFVPASLASVSQPMPSNIQFPNPVRTVANEALNIAAITTSAQLYVNLQGYTAP